MKSLALQSSLWYSLLLVALISLSIHCKDHTTKAIFDKTSLQRGEDRKILLREKLKDSPYGWKILYQPASFNSGTGYFQFLFRFLNDTEVEVAADFSSDDLAFPKSEYSILLGATFKLSFSTACPLHQLSDSGFSPITGAAYKGLLGSFEFLYYGENEQGDLIFRTNRTNETLLFQKATENSLNEIKASFPHFKKLTFQERIRFILLTESKGGDRNLFQIELLEGRRVLEISSVGETEIDGVIMPSPDRRYATAYGLTPDGIFIDEIRRNSGEILRNLHFKNTSNSENDLRFESTLADGTLLTISNSNKSLFPVLYFEDFLATFSCLNYYYTNSEINSSPDFFKLMKEMKSHGFTGEFSLCHQVQLYEEKEDYLSMPGTAGVEGLPVFQGLIYVFDKKTNRVVIKKNASIADGEAVKPEMEEVFNKFMTILTDSEGFYVKGLGRGYHRTDLNMDVGELLRFISVKYPEMEFTTLYEIKK